MNRLKDCHSSFLREAAEQPVDWYPWGEEAFERAKREDKPVLVDVGAVWCHWCHVMDRETYSDPEIALFINTNFVAVKVDRDEMPSLDRKLQRAVSSITGESGWPLTVFMTPEGTVFFEDVLSSSGHVRKDRNEEVVEGDPQDMERGEGQNKGSCPSPDGLLTFGKPNPVF